MSERKPGGISSRYWFSLPRGSRLRTIREEHERFLFAIEWAIDAAEQTLVESMTAGLYRDTP